MLVNAINNLVLHPLGMLANQSISLLTSRHLRLETHGHTSDWIPYPLTVTSVFLPRFPICVFRACRILPSVRIATPDCMSFLVWLLPNVEETVCGSCNQDVFEAPFLFEHPLFLCPWMRK